MGTGGDSPEYILAVLSPLSPQQKMSGDASSPRPVWLSPLSPLSPCIFMVARTAKITHEKQQKHRHYTAYRLISPCKTMKSQEHTKPARRPDGARDTGHFQHMRKSVHFCRKTHFFSSKNTGGQTRRGLQPCLLCWHAIFWRMYCTANGHAARASTGPDKKPRRQTHRKRGKTAKNTCFYHSRRLILCSVHSHHRMNSASLSAHYPSPQHQKPPHGLATTPTHGRSRTNPATTQRGRRLSRPVRHGWPPVMRISAM